MRDLVERLRDADYANAPSRCMEGAKEIESLRAQLASARKALEEIRDWYPRIDIDHVEYRVRSCQAAIDALSALTDEKGKS